MAMSLFLLIIIVFIHHFHFSYGLSESEILLKFKTFLPRNSAMDTWTDHIPPCNGNKAKWVGVVCVSGSVWGIKLEKMGMAGTLDFEVLKQLPNLRTVSFMGNKFEGNFPDVKTLGGLKAVYLSNNQFSGKIPANAFEGMLWLKKLHLANNLLTGDIPESLATLPKLLDLRLEGNKFKGSIPPFQQKQWQSFNVSANQLDGKIPPSLANIDITSFSGNQGLCGKPLNNVCPAMLSSSSSTSNKPDCKEESIGKITFVVLVIVVGVALSAIIAAIIILRRNRASHQLLELPLTPSNLQNKSGMRRDSDNASQCSPAHSTSSSKKSELAAKLCFVREDRIRFDLQDLLKASAEILGSGCFGASYKAALLTGPVMVVKRFKQMNNVGREEFQEHMRRLGRLRHPNLLPLVSYYFKKEEKLLISDYVDNGSLAVSLHGHQALGRPSLDWPTRLKIVKGVANGISYLYKELPNLIAPHGHLKSSNVLLNESMEPLLTDYGLIPLINQESAQELMVAYKSPEYSQYGRVTRKTDVWGLGMLILEILTGRFPSNFLQQGKASDEEDLASWVKSVMGDEEEPSGELLDKEVVVTKETKGEMLKLLKIGMGCCEADTEKRLDLKEAMRRIEEIKVSED